ncbi:MAG TPA: copper transporter [Mycobacteriales bacterium]|nr:copper transporter [Mycobacteriales bacterium]
MIDFRYHLVSIVAVFLALAVGIVLGTAAANGPVLDNLRGNIAGLTNEKRGLEDSVRDLQGRVDGSEEFARIVAPSLLAGVLPGQKIVLVQAPGASTSLVTDLAPLFTQAGATVVARVQLREALLDPGSSRLLDDLVTKVRTPGLTLPEGEPVDRAAVQLAAALVRRPGTTPLTADAAAGVLAAYREADLVDVDAPAGAAAVSTATLAVIVTGSPEGGPLDADGESRRRAVLSVARALEIRSRGVVVAGPVDAAKEGGVLQALRADGELGAQITSVDSADTDAGGIAVVLALREQANGGAGSYGSGPGADAAVPSLARR